MVDYVIREQFKCGSENNLDNSPVYDGWLQKPLYMKEFYSNNKSHKQDELFVTLSSIPESLKNYNFQSNIILIKNNTAINYTIPLSVKMADFSLLDFKPFLDTVKLLDIDTNIVIRVFQNFYFKKNSDIPLEDVESILNNSFFRKSTDEFKIDSIYIVGYSSIEGDSLKNSNLQQKRVELVKKHILGFNNFDSLNIKTDTKENINCFLKDFGNLMDNDEKQSLSSLNQFYLKNKTLIDEEILSKHRYTELSYNVNLKLNKETSVNVLQIIYDNFHQLDNNTKLKFLKIILYKLQNDGFAFKLDAENYSWLNNKTYQLPLYFYDSDSSNFRKIYNEQKKTQKWTDTLIYNFVIANFKFYKEYSTPFISFNELEKLIIRLNNKTVSDLTKNTLWLNFYLIKAKYYYKLKKTTEVNIALEQFKKIYLSFKPKVKDLIKIGQFFNHYNKFDWTLQLLYPMLHDYPENEDLWFTYISTYTFVEYPDFDDTKLKELILNCIKLNKNRFCRWIDLQDFQLLRTPIFKDNYCKECNE